MVVACNKPMQTTYKHIRETSVETTLESKIKFRVETFMAHDTENIRPIKFTTINHYNYRLTAEEALDLSNALRDAAHIVRVPVPVPDHQATEPALTE